MSRKHSHAGRPIETLETRTLFNAGALDTTFGTNGQSNAFGFQINAEAVQADGKTVVVGEDNNNHFVVGRLDVNGAIDTTFGSHGAGSVVTDFGTAVALAEAVTLQSDGRIVVAGASGSGDKSWVVARYNPDGTPDATFGAGGKTTVLGTTDGCRIVDIAVQPGGKIVFEATRSFDPFLARLQANGSLDTTFGDAAGSARKGYTRVPDDMAIEAMAIQSDGKIVVGCGGGGFSVTDYTMYARRFTADGRLDSTFGTNGILQATPAVGAILTGITVAPDDQIYLAGQDRSKIVLRKADRDGHLDPTFGGNGIVITDFGSDAFYHNPTSILVPQADKVLVVGAESFSGAPYASNRVIARQFNADGTVDKSFGTGGVAQFDVGFPVIQSAARLTPDGKVVFATTGGFEDQSPSAVVRFDGHVPIVTVVAGGSGAAAEDGTITGTVVFQRDAAFNFNTRVYFRTSGTATAAVDYTGRLAPTLQTKNGPVVNPLAQFVDIPAGQTSVTVPLTVVDDGLLENVENATVTITPDASFVIGSRFNGKVVVPANAATISIYDNDGVNVSFRPANDAPPAGFAADTGAVFGARANGFTYGWDTDISSLARDRNDPRSPAEAFDAFNQTQKNGLDSKWEIALPNGLYKVTVAAGDAGATDSVYRYSLENVPVLTGTPTGDTRWFQSTTIVQVSDGRLTLTNGPGAQNNKIDFLQIEAAGFGAKVGPVIGSTGISLLPAPVSPVRATF